MLRKIIFFLIFGCVISLNAFDNNVSHLLAVDWKDQGIILHFDTTIDPKAIHLSAILEPDKQRFRYILDFANATGKSQAFISRANHKIRLSLYKQKMVRVVIEYQEAMKIYPVVAEGGNVYIDLALPSQELPPQTPNLSPIPAQEIPPPPTNPAKNVYPPKHRTKRNPSEPTPSDSKEEPKVLEKPPKVIVIDPGHGGKDAGAIGNGVVEKEIVLQIALQLSQQLRDMGYTVYMTRTNDTFIELKERTQLANDKLADLFLSIHANSIPKTSDPLATRGVETYYLSPGRSERAKGVAAFENAAAMSEMGEYGKLSFLNIINSEKILASHKLAIDIERGVTGVLQKHYANVKNNGAKEAPFWVLVGAQMPAILLEIGYISHPEESAHLANREYQQGIVQGMVEGVTHYFINNP
jgi:N-acetylmuramoyl-L-alanine amidase